MRSYFWGGCLVALAAVLAWALGPTPRASGEVVAPPAPAVAPAPVAAETPEPPFATPAHGPGVLIPVTFLLPAADAE